MQAYTYTYTSTMVWIIYFKGETPWNNSQAKCFKGPSAYIFSNLKMSIPGTKDSLQNGELSPGSRNEKRSISSTFYCCESRWVPWSRSQILMGRSLGRVFGKTHFHHCGFNVSGAICLCRLIYGVETELSGELMWPSNGSWECIRTSPMPIPLPVDGCG